MRKFLKFAILLLWGMALFSCTKTQNPDSGLERIDIKSVVWSADENLGRYTFWFSPTEGLVDVDAMKLADDYIKIIVNEPGEAISLATDGNSIAYGQYNVQASNLSDFTSAELSLLLPSENTVKLSVRVSDAKGGGFVSNFHGFCAKSPAEQLTQRKLRLDRQVFFRYYRDINSISGIRDYYIAFSNAPFKVSNGNLSLTTEGYIVAIELCAVQTEERKLELPVGTYSLTGYYSDHSWILSNTIVIHYDKSLTNDATCYICDDVEIVEKNGIYTIRTAFQDRDLGLTTIEYVGKIDEAEDWSGLYGY